MELVFKKFEVIGKTVDEAKKAAAPMNLMTNVTGAYKKWAEANTVDERSLKEWAKEQLKKKNYDDKSYTGLYVILQSPVVDTRERPYKLNKLKYDKRTHSFKKMYVIRDLATNTEIGVKKTSNEAIDFAKEWTTLNQESCQIFVEAKIEEKNSLYATCDYTPTKGARPAKLLVFGYVPVED